MAIVETTTQRPVEQTQAVEPRQSWRLRFARGLQRVSGACSRLPRPVSTVFAPIAKLLFEGVGLGLMTPDDIQQMVVDTYKSRPEFYDPRRYRFRYEERLLPDLKKLTAENSEGVRLLDAFCGQGREAEIFANAGFDVTGVDHLDWMINSAREYAAEANFTATFTTSDFAEFRADPPFDVVYTSCWMYSTSQGRQRRVELLQKCMELTSDDGLIVVSSVDASVGSQFVAKVRFALAKFVAALTFGNTATEFGERIYSGLFWHHLADSTVRAEIESVGLKVVTTISGQGIDPRFYILSRNPSDDAEGRP